MVKNDLQHIFFLFCLYWLACDGLSSGYLPVKNGEIFYESVGNGDPIILIHGGYGDRRMWDSQFVALSEKHEIIRYDHRGFGKSQTPTAPYSPCDDLIKLLDHLNIPTVHLIGNSMGGTIAIDFTILHPQRVKSLIIVAAGPSGYPIPQEAYQSVVSVFDTASYNTAKALEMWLHRPLLQVTNKNESTRSWLYKMALENKSIFLMKYWPNEKLDPTAYERLNEIRCPTLMIGGSYDMPYTINMIDSTVARINGAKKIIMSDADHLPHMNDPEKFNRVVLEFIGSVKN